MSDPLSETWMWDRAQELLDKAGRIQRQFFNLAAPGGRGAVWEPPLDVFEREDSLLVVIALPGVSPESTRVELRGRVLLVSGERGQPSPCREAAVRRMEIPTGRFQRAVELPGGLLELGECQANDGCLFVRVEKRGEDPAQGDVRDQG
jgi:HSP20 family protein